jgi:sporulation protein YlmC with PRC-barrel domain
MKRSIEEIIGRALMTNQGAIMGTIKYALFDDDTGEPSHLIVTPSRDVNTQSYQHNHHGHIVVPYAKVTRIPLSREMHVGNQDKA